MRQWSDKRLKALIAFKLDQQPIFRNLSVITRDLGFEYWCYTVIDPHHMDAVLILHTNLPDDWIGEYAAGDFFAQDPRRHHGLASLRPLHWQPALFACAPQLWHAMCEINVTQGMSQACHHGSGLVAILCLCRSATLKLGRNEFNDKVDKVLSLANQLTVASVERIGNDRSLQLQSEVTAPLTRRQVAILQKTAEGLTAADIAEVMSLSERTVQFHISRVIARLDVPNKTAAVVQAIKRGLFDPP